MGLSEPVKMEVILRNSKGFKPAQRRSLLARVRGVLGLPCDLRITPRFVEVVLFGRPDGEAIRELEKVIGSVVEIVEGEPVPEGPEAVEKVKEYLREGYYWRAHVAGEEAWHRGGGEEARVLALIAGALAKAQEGNLGAAKKILAKAERAGGWGVDYRCLERVLELVVEGVQDDANKCIREEWLRQVLSPLTRPSAVAGR